MISLLFLIIIPILLTLYYISAVLAVRDLKDTQTKEDDFNDSLRELEALKVTHTKTLVRVDELEWGLVKNAELKKEGRYNKWNKGSGDYCQSHNK